MLKKRFHVFYLFLICCTGVLACETNSIREANQQQDEVSSLSNVAFSDLEETVTVQAEKQSILLKLKENNHLPVEERVALFYQLKKENPNGYDFDNEEDLNLYGYTLLWDKKVSEAVEIFKLVVAEFPNSSNAYDSLGEAYLADNNQELSLVNYEKSLALNPENFAAEDQIERMKFPERIITLVEKRVKIYSVEQYRSDIDKLGRSLREVNPNAFKFISKADFNQLIADKKALINPETTFGKFSWYCSEIIASINCSHTSMGRFNLENAMLPVDKRFPLQVRLIEGRLYVIDALNNEKNVQVKDEILTINSVPVSELIQDIYKHISSQGYVETTKRIQFNRWATGIIPFALDFPENFEVEVKGKKKSIALDEPNASNDPMSDVSIDYCGNDLCLEVLDKQTALMTIYSFNYYRWNNYAEFEKFADESFAELKENQIENLVIDVRFNGGGSPESSIYLLKYLMSQPFNYFGETDYGEGEGLQTPFDKHFTGNLYFIIDGNGNSTTGHFMALVKYHKLGTIVGEELGSNQFCTGGQKTIRLPNTRLEFYVGMSTSQLADVEFPDETGILPDYYVTQSIDDYLNHVDAVSIYTLNLIK